MFWYPQLRTFQVHSVQVKRFQEWSSVLPPGLGRAAEGRGRGQSNQCVHYCAPPGVALDRLLRFWDNLEPIWELLRLVGPFSLGVTKGYPRMVLWDLWNDLSSRFLPEWEDLLVGVSSFFRFLTASAWDFEALRPSPRSPLLSRLGKAETEGPAPRSSEVSVPRVTILTPLLPRGVTAAPGAAPWSGSMSGNMQNVPEACAWTPSEVT